LTSAEVFGLLGGACITGGFIPQIVRVFQLRSAREISLPFTLLFLGGSISWLLYGILKDLFSVILWNSISFVLVSLLIYAKLKYGR
jgi:MtN3 and saliva related transmembrane protein